jgi:ketosteroid isomerase-like protein
MHLPPAIQAYFDADRRNDCEAVVACFAPDATVHDEGRSHAGHYAIGTWWEQSKARYRHMAEPLEAQDHDGISRVRARITGEFPGSPAMLTFAFSLAADKISSLEIGA